LYSRLVISAVVVAIKEYNDPTATVTNDASVAMKMLEILKSAALRPYNQLTRQPTMSTSLQSADYTQKHRETVQSRYGSAEILEIYSPAGRFIGFQVYRNGSPEYAPFQTLKGAQLCAKRPRWRSEIHRLD